MAGRMKLKPPIGWWVKAMGDAAGKPCEQGQSAAQTGCIPAKEEAFQSATTTSTNIYQVDKQYQEKYPQEMRTRLAKAVEQRLNRLSPESVKKLGKEFGFGYFKGKMAVTNIVTQLYQLVRDGSRQGAEKLLEMLKVDVTPEATVEKSDQAAAQRSDEWAAQAAPKEQEPEQVKKERFTATSVPATLPSAPTPDYVGQPIKYDAHHNYSPPNWLIADTKRLHQQATFKERAALGNYCSEWESDEEFPDMIGCYELNEAMRQCPPDFKCVKGYKRKAMEAIFSLFEKALPFKQEVTVYRVINCSKEEMGQLLDAAKQMKEAGTVYTMPSFTSTSLNPSYAATKQDGGVSFHIKAKSGIYTGGSGKGWDEPGTFAFSSNAMEQEIIQSPRCKYRVVGVAATNVVEAEEGKEGKVIPSNVIYLEEIGYE